MANPTKLTPEVHKFIVEAIEAGNYRKTAAAAAGVHENRIGEWVKRGRTGEEPYASLTAAMDVAEAKGEMAALNRLRNPPKGHVWQVDAWFLERRHGDKWCSRIKQQVAESIDALTDKLKAKPEIHSAVVKILTDDGESPTAGTTEH
jgi:hypothetical protein